MMPIKNGVITGELSEICQQHFICFVRVCVLILSLHVCDREKADLQLIFGN